MVKVDRRIRWHYTTTILRLRIGARLTRYRDCKFHNFARTISRHADGISRYYVPPSAGPLLPLHVSIMSTNTNLIMLQLYPVICRLHVISDQGCIALLKMGKNGYFATVKLKFQASNIAVIIKSGFLC